MLHVKQAVNFRLHIVRLNATGFLARPRVWTLELSPLRQIGSFNSSTAASFSQIPIPFQIARSSPAPPCDAHLSAGHHTAAKSAAMGSQPGGKGRDMFSVYQNPSVSRALASRSARLSVPELLVLAVLPVASAYFLLALSSR
jgi:hypothetical protein